MAPNMSRKRAASVESLDADAKRIKRPKSIAIEPRAPVHKVSARQSTPTQDQLLQASVCGDSLPGGLGLGKNRLDVTCPRHNPYLKDILHISAGRWHAVAITSNNELLTWGDNVDGALGRITLDDGEEEEYRADVPTAVDMNHFPTNVKLLQVATGDNATFARTDQGTVYGWGTLENRDGLRGVARVRPLWGQESERFVPTRIPHLNHIVDISAGADFVLALDRAGQVFSWGCNQYCELGRDTTNPWQALLPDRVALSHATKIRSVHAGASHAFAIDEEGDTWAWGLNASGQTGIRSGINRPNATVQLPSKVPSLIGKDMKMVAAGLYHSIGLTISGQCFIWGRSDGNLMGIDIDKIVDQNACIRDKLRNPRMLVKPTLLPIPKCSHVAAGPDHSLAITKRGKVFSWGFNYAHQCGHRTKGNTLTPKTITSVSLVKKRVVWAGAGGRYSMFLSESKVKKK